MKLLDFVRWGRIFSFDFRGTERFLTILHSGFGSDFGLCLPNFGLGHTQIGAFHAHKKS